MIDRRPALVVRCAGAADVIAGLRFAREHELVPAVRGGSHNVAGFGTCDDGVVLDLSPMKGIRIDPRSSTARVQGGVVWGELDHETQAFSLATTGGLVSSTGIGGFTLGGGIGWLMRKHCLACDNLVAADVVTADGRLVSASAVENEELFWGLRGGGGNFGIVTSFEFRLHPVGPVVFGGALFYELERAHELLRTRRAAAVPRAAGNVRRERAAGHPLLLEESVPRRARGRCHRRARRRHRLFRVAVQHRARPPRRGRRCARLG
jgi:FAD/FMN-containing dehydrogenase